MKYYLLALLAFLGMFSCKKQVASNADILSYSIEGKQVQVSIIASSHSINITFPDSVMNAADLIADFTLSPGCKASVKNVEQVSGVTKNDFSSIIHYNISSSDNDVDWTVTSTNNNYTASYGLGSFLEQSASEDCSYSWYMDQVSSGTYYYENCGPTSVTMACKWADSTFAKTPLDARNTYRPTGGWWSTDDINAYLIDNNIPHTSISLASTAETTAGILQHEIDVQQLVILCLDMNLVRSADNASFHTDKFYKTTPQFGHFIIVKGYKQVNNEMFFDVYDPYSLSAEYNDGTLMGKDRYYRYEDLFEATLNWWPNAIIVAKKDATLINNFSNHAKDLPAQFGK